MVITYERGCFSYRGMVSVEGAEVGTFGPSVDGRVWVNIDGDAYTVSTDREAQSLIMKLYTQYL